MPTPRIENLDTSRIAHIMTEALKEFAQHDYHKSSFNRIIKNCGMSKGTMYYYFENKKDLFMTLLNGTAKEFGSLKDDSGKVFETAEEYWGEVERLLQGLLRIMKDKPVLGRFIQNFLRRESRRSENPAELVVERVDIWLEDFILSGQLNGAIRRDLPMDLQLQIAWGIWESCSDWLESSVLQMDSGEAASIISEQLKRALENHSLATDK